MNPLKQLLKKWTDISLIVRILVGLAIGAILGLTLPSWTDGLSYQEQYNALRNHLCFHHGIDPDKSGSDVSRACFLPYDPDCFINPKYL